MSGLDFSFSVCGTVMDTTLDFGCGVTQSSLVLSYLRLPFSLPPYHIPLLDLLALCWCPRAPSCPLLPLSAVYPEGAFRLVKGSTGCCAATAYCVFPFTPFSLLQFCSFSAFASSLRHFISNAPQSQCEKLHRIRESDTYIPFYELSGSTASPSVADKCPQSPHCLV